MAKTVDVFLCKIQTMIHRSKIFEIVETLGEFSLRWIAKTGNFVNIDDAVFMSSYITEDEDLMIRVRCKKSGEIRETSVNHITEINGEEVIA